MRTDITLANAASSRASAWAGLALMCVVCGPAVALAQSVTPSQAVALGVAAAAPELCVLAPSGSIIATSQTGSNTVGPIGASLTISDLVDPDTLTTRSATGRLSFSGACNYPHQVRISSRNNGLLRDGGGASQTVAWAVPYRAVLSWGGSTLALNADARTQEVRIASFIAPTATDGDLIVDVEIDTGATNLGPNRPLGAGQYSDVISVEVGPL
jgi:hypothetical protein